VIDVLVLGDANVDLVLRGDVVPRFNQAEQILDAATLVLGGSAGITAHALARLGRATRIGALTGRDVFGDQVVDLLAAAGVDTTTVVRDPGRTTGLTVVLSQGQERAILTFLGAISAYSIDQATAQLKLINQVPSGGGDPSYISLDRTSHFVLVANYEGGNIGVWALKPDGSLGERTAFVQHTGSTSDGIDSGGADCAA